MSGSGSDARRHALRSRKTAAASLREWTPNLVKIEAMWLLIVLSARKRRLGDLGVGVALADEVEDLALAVGEGRAARRRRGGGGGRPTGRLRRRGAGHQGGLDLGLEDERVGAGFERAADRGARSSAARRRRSPARRASRRSRRSAVTAARSVDVAGEDQDGGRGELVLGQRLGRGDSCRLHPGAGHRRRSGRGAPLRPSAITIDVQGANSVRGRRGCCLLTTDISD